MTSRRRPLFVSRDVYRSRRLKDASRLLPVIGAALFALPLLWRSEEGASVGTAGTLLYILAVWAGLILSAFLIARRLARDEPPGAAQSPAAPPGDG